ncbi:MAG TPA: hypothetical protein VN906_09315 [Candidatus Sulfotelmatobacter sp.]|jgi:hypothetical protein|nr:hypothetical protein [Candidatus Sulfotelmatobacter sp.]
MPECIGVDGWLRTGDICVVGYGSAGDTGARADAMRLAEKAGREYREELVKWAKRFKCPTGCKKGTIDIGNPEVDEPTETIEPRDGYDYPRAKSVRDIILDHRYCTRAWIHVLIECYPVKG